MILAVLMLCPPVHAGLTQDSDALFLQARSLPKGRRAEARELLRQALRRSPGYHEVRIHLARMHAWDAQYEEARREVALVLEQDPRNLEAREVAADVETWADRPAEALRHCEAGLAVAPGHIPFHFRKARLLKAAGDPKGALAAVQAVLSRDPGHPEARRLRDDLAELLQRWKAGVDLSYDGFSGEGAPWRTASLSLGHRFDRGTVTGRINRAQRFGAWGTQLEVEAYPRLREGTYAYVGAGHSRDPFFPRLSLGAEIFQNFSGGVEGSLGVRRLDFGASPVTLWTASGGYYLGAALYTLRMHVTPGRAGTSLSGALSGRWYLGEDADSYLSASVGAGYSPEQFAWTEEVLTMRSRKLSLGWQRRITGSWILSTGLGWVHREIRPDTFQTQWTFTGGVARRF